jgi:DNA-binding PadR family transcriptional regulator
VFGQKARLERDFLAALETLQQHGQPEASGFALTRFVERQRGYRHWWQVIGFGSAYLALDHLEHQGLVTSRWEHLSGWDYPQRLYRLVAQKEETFQ